MPVVTDRLYRTGSRRRCERRRRARTTGRWSPNRQYRPAGHRAGLCDRHWRARHLAKRIRRPVWRAAYFRTSRRYDTPEPAWRAWSMRRVYIYCRHECRTASRVSAEFLCHPHGVRCRHQCRAARRCTDARGVSPARSVLERTQPALAVHPVDHAECRGPVLSPAPPARSPVARLGRLAGLAAGAAGDRRCVPRRVSGWGCAPVRR